MKYEKMTILLRVFEVTPAHHLWLRGTTSTSTTTSTQTATTNFRSTAAGTAGRAVTTLLLGLDSDTNLAGIIVDNKPHSTPATLGGWQAVDDSLLRRIDSGELNKGTGFAANDVHLFDSTEPGQFGTQLGLSDNLKDALYKG